MQIILISISKQKASEFVLLSDQIRTSYYIPFYLGTRLTPELFEEISYYLSKNYQVITLTKKEKVIVWKIYLRKNLWSIISIYFSNRKWVQTPNLYREHDFCRKIPWEKKQAHQKILHWTHNISPIMYVITKELRELVRYHQQVLLPSASSNWEYNGFSYVITMFFSARFAAPWIPPTLSVCPTFYKNKGIPAILKPDLIVYDDSNELSRMGQKRKKSWNTWKTGAIITWGNIHLKRDHCHWSDPLWHIIKIKLDVNLFCWSPHARLPVLPPNTPTRKHSVFLFETDNIAVSDHGRWIATLFARALTRQRSQKWPGVYLMAHILLHQRLLQRVGPFFHSSLFWVRIHFNKHP